MTIYALDSNIISYYLKGDKKLIERINNGKKRQYNNTAYCIL
jgi:predicted nucleic acid-binding protein